MNNILKQIKDKYIIIITIIIYILLIFQCFIFNEQIICNFCGLNKNTKNEISERSEKETNTILNSKSLEVSNNTINYNIYNI